MQEDKLYVFDTTDTLLVTIPVMAEMVVTLRINAERMREAAGEGFTLATDVADYLVGKGIPFRDAHRIVGQLVRKCIDENIKLNELTPEDLQKASTVFDDSFYRLVDGIQAAVERKESPGGTAPCG